MSLQILVQIRVREILSQNLWLLPRPISDAYILYIVIVRHKVRADKSHEYVNNCKNPFPFNIA